jgi:hypothetical protein
VFADFQNPITMRRSILDDAAIGFERSPDLVHGNNLKFAGVDHGGLISIQYHQG